MIILLNLIYNKIKKYFFNEFENEYNYEWYLNDDDLGIKIDFIWNII